MKLGLVILATTQASLFESYNALIAVRNALTLCEIEGIKGREIGGRDPNLRPNEQVTIISVTNNSCLGHVKSLPSCDILRRSADKLQRSIMSELKTPKSKQK